MEQASFKGEMVKAVTMKMITYKNTANTQKTKRTLMKSTAKNKDDSISNECHNLSMPKNLV